MYARSSMKFRSMLLSALCATALLGGCSAMTPAADAPPLDGTAWRLSTLAGRTWSGAPATASFEGGRVQGTDGCNRYSAPYSARGDAFEVGPRGVSTMMACPAETMKQAEAFMAALSGAKSYRFTNGQLELLGATGSVLATLAPQSGSLAGTSWQVTGIMARLRVPPAATSTRRVRRLMARVSASSPQRRRARCVLASA
jgi:heat shock protein HslJ